MRQAVAGVNLGGTCIEAAVADWDGSVLAETAIRSR